jgi:hypothetical protein
MKNQLYTRTYEGGNGEEVIVVGNRKDVSDPVEGVMEAEFVFRDGKLTAVNARRFNEMSTYVCSYVVDPDESDGIQKDQEWFEMDIAAPRRVWNNGEALNDYLQHRVRDLSGRPTARLWQFRRIETETPDIRTDAGVETTTPEQENN